MWEINGHVFNSTREALIHLYIETNDLVDERVDTAEERLVLAGYTIVAAKKRRWLMFKAKVKKIVRNALVKIGRLERHFR